MKKIKQIFWLVALVPLLYGQLGCKKFLDRKPLGQAIDGDVSGGGAQSQVFGLYSATRLWGMTGLAFLTMHGARADDNYNSTAGDGSDQQDIVDNFNYVKDHWSLNSLWDDHYTFITQANAIIHDVDSAYSTDPSSIVNEAEARFLRAYAYFDLVRDYGEVPIIKNKVYKPSDAIAAKSPVADVYAFIDEDLQYAIAHLPATWSSEYLGRATMGAANALQAKTYLYRQQWSNALASAEAVINSGLYSLDPSYSHLFSEAAENGSESIFEIQNYENANGSIGGDGSYSNGLPVYQAVRGAGDWNLGWGWNLPTATLVNDAYETDDPRKGATILESGQPDNVYGGITYGVSLPASGTPYWNKKVYSDPARRAATGDKGANWLNTRIYRYADVLLMAAEAANETGNSSKALSYLEMVRARARDGKTGILPAVTSTDQGVIRTAIKKERRVEFAMEFERFYDLVRWTPATDNIDAPNVLGPLGYTTKNKYYPIPQEAIDKSEINGVKILVQNPDYP